MESISNRTSEDKIWAALAHASVLFSFWGPVVPALLWSLQRRKSAHVRFHAVQALAYQITSFWVGALLIPLLVIVMMVVMVAAIGFSESQPGNPRAELVAVMVPFLMYAPILAAMGLYVLVGLIGAVASLTGRNFLYPFLGASLRRKLGYEPGAEARILEEQEDRVVAAASHATCILTMFGVVTPLLVWITQKDRGEFIRFQSLQALVYQGLGTLAYVVFMALYMVTAFGSMGLTIAAPPDLGLGSSDAPFAAFAILVPMVCAGTAFLLFGPLYHLFGFIASLRVLRGGDYNYPLLGRYLRKHAGSSGTEAAS